MRKGKVDLISSGVNVRKPEWACNNYGNYGHDWLDCPKCLESYDEYCNEEELTDE
jgi:hypothetical protein